VGFLNTFTYANNPAAFSSETVNKKGIIKIKWKKVRSVVLLKKYQTIIIRGEIGQKMKVFYQRENETVVVEEIKNNFEKITMV